MRCRLTALPEFLKYASNRDLLIHQTLLTYLRFWSETDFVLRWYLLLVCIFRTPIWLILYYIFTDKAYTPTTISRTYTDPPTTIARTNADPHTAKARLIADPPTNNAEMIAYPLPTKSEMDIPSGNSWSACSNPVDVEPSGDSDAEETNRFLFNGTLMTVVQGW